MKWKQEYELGISEIDAQHQQILEFITAFENLHRDGAHWNEIHPLIVRTREFVRFHFSVEESLMQVLRYPLPEPHHAEHRYVLDHLATLERQVLHKRVAEDLVPKMRHWLFDHIIGIDRDFARFVLSRYGDWNHVIDARR